VSLSECSSYGGSESIARTRPRRACAVQRPNYAGNTCFTTHLWALVDLSSSDEEEVSAAGPSTSRTRGCRKRRASPEAPEDVAESDQDVDATPTQSSSSRTRKRRASFEPPKNDFADEIIGNAIYH